MYERLPSYQRIFQTLILRIQSSLGKKIYKINRYAFILLVQRALPLLNISKFDFSFFSQKNLLCSMCRNKEDLMRYFFPPLGNCQRTSDTGQLRRFKSQQEFIEDIYQHITTFNAFIKLSFKSLCLYLYIEKYKIT